MPRPRPPTALPPTGTPKSSSSASASAVRTTRAPSAAHHARAAAPSAVSRRGCVSACACYCVGPRVWYRGGGDAALRLSCCVSMSACSFRKKMCAVSPSELTTIGTTTIDLQRTFGLTVDKVAKPKRLGNRASHHPRVLSHIQNLFTDENKTMGRKNTPHHCVFTRTGGLEGEREEGGRAFVVPRRPSPKPIVLTDRVLHPEAFAFLARALSVC